MYWISNTACSVEEQYATWCSAILLPLFCWSSHLRCLVRVRSSLRPFLCIKLTIESLYATRKHMKCIVSSPVREGINAALLSGVLNHCPSTPHDIALVASCNITGFRIDRMQTAGGVCIQRTPALLNYIMSLKVGEKCFTWFIAWGVGLIMTC